MKKLVYPLTCVALISVLTACGMNNNRAIGPETPGNRNARALTYNGDQMYDHATPTPYNTYKAPRNMNEPMFDSTMASRISQVADNVPGVEKATAVVSGNDAVVGIQHRIAATDVRQRQVVERQVREAVRSIAPRMNVRVTSQSDMLTRIQNLDNGIRTGYGNVTSGPTTVRGNLTNVGTDFTSLLRDLGRTVTAPFR